MKIDHIKPYEIEKRSFEIIGEILAESGIQLDPDKESVIKRVIHTTADFDHAKQMYFSENVVSIFCTALKNGADIVTDTQMAKSGINKSKLASYGGTVHCFISDEDVAGEAKRRGITRAAVAMEKAQKIKKPLIFAIGNAPTALIHICELVQQGKLSPVGIIGVPVGFVNVIESKNLLISSGIPSIATIGRKGGSNIAAAICNALLYQLD